MPIGSIKPLSEVKFLPKGWKLQLQSKRVLIVVDDEYRKRFIVIMRPFKDGNKFLSAKLELDSICAPYSKYTDLETALKLGLVRCRLGAW
jgi:predicted aldo/keto reductase-like oxidoreductase